MTIDGRGVERWHIVTIFHVEVIDTYRAVKYRLMFTDMSGLSQCEDILLFQRTLKKLRDIDDKIIYALNLSTPTKSFQVRSF